MHFWQRRTYSGCTTSSVIAAPLPLPSNAVHIRLPIRSILAPLSSAWLFPSSVCFFLMPRHCVFASILQNILHLPESYFTVTNTTLNLLTIALRHPHGRRTTPATILLLDHTCTSHLPQTPPTTSTLPFQSLHLQFTISMPICAATQISRKMPHNTMTSDTLQPIPNSFLQCASLSKPVTHLFFTSLHFYSSN